MKSHAILMVVALVVQAFLAQTAMAAEELAIPPEAVAPPVELGPLPGEFECPCEEPGSPLTLMQWSYGDGADGNVMYRPLQSDRPYFTKSASAVGLGTWQLEAGYTYARESEGRRDNTFHSFPETELRMGALAEWFEFRLGWSWLEHRTDSNARDLSGSTDPIVGIKIALTPQDEMLPETAVLIDTNLPSSLFNSLDRNKMQPGVDLIYRWRLSKEWAMGGSSKFRRVSLNRRDSAIGFGQSWIFERSITDLLTGYAEWVMFSVDTPPDPDTLQYLDGGFLYLITDDLQFDVSVGYGLNQAATDYFCGIGVTIRR